MALLARPGSEWARLWDRHWDRLWPAGGYSVRCAGKKTGGQCAPGGEWERKSTWLVVKFWCERQVSCVAANGSWLGDSVPKRAPLERGFTTKWKCCQGQSTSRKRCAATDSCFVRYRYLRQLWY